MAKKYTTSRLFQTAEVTHRPTSVLFHERPIGLIDVMRRTDLSDFQVLDPAAAEGIDLASDLDCLFDIDPG